MKKKFCCFDGITGLKILGKSKISIDDNGIINGADNAYQDEDFLIVDVGESSQKIASRRGNIAMGPSNVIINNSTNVKTTGNSIVQVGNGTIVISKGNVNNVVKNGSNSIPVCDKDDESPVTIFALAGDSVLEKLIVRNNGKLSFDSAKFLASDIDVDVMHIGSLKIPSKRFSSLNVIVAGKGSVCGSGETSTNTISVGVRCFGSLDKIHVYDSANLSANGTGKISITTSDTDNVTQKTTDNARICVRVDTK